MRSTMSQSLLRTLRRAGWADRDPRGGTGSAAAVLEWTDGGAVSARVILEDGGDLIFSETSGTSSALVHFDAVTPENVDRVAAYIIGAVAS